MHSSVHSRQEKLIFELTLVYIYKIVIISPQLDDYNSETTSRISTS